MMGTFRCDHPDIEAFIDAKQDTTKLRMSNLSVLVTYVFMTAVSQDDLWNLRIDGTAHKSIRACGLWDRIIRSTFDTPEPGVIFIDSINAAKNPYRLMERAFSAPSIWPPASSPNLSRRAPPTIQYFAPCRFMTYVPQPPALRDP